MSSSLQQASYLGSFQCLGAECEDTCCQGWDMPLDPVRKRLYEEEKPQLLADTIEKDGTRIMRRDAKSDCCVRLEAGWCGIHREHGEDMLGDACYFYPRITRRLGDRLYRTATPSCPEIARRALFSDHDPAGFEEADAGRLPVTVTDYAPPGLSGEEASAIAAQTIAFTQDKGLSPAMILIRLRSVAESLNRQPTANWPAAFSFYLKNSGGLIAEAESESQDSYALLHRLAALVKAAPPAARLRLRETMAQMEHTLGVKIDPETLDMMAAEEGSDLHSAGILRTRWHEHGEAVFEPLLRRWLQMQLAGGLFPFAGFGRTPVERITILAVRFATLKLALAAHIGENGTLPSHDTQLRIIQSLARFMDHLADPALSIALYEGAGWMREARLRGLLEW